MARARSPDREKAKQLYLESKGSKPLIEIASELNIKDTQVRKWKSLDKWEDELKGTLPITKRNVTKQNKGTGTKKLEAIAEAVESVIDNPDLNDKQRLFCLYYSRSFNATSAYQKAYGCSYETAMANGCELLRRTKIRDEIMRLKKARMNRELLLESDIFEKYMQMAFADITDYLSFGMEEVPVMTMYGPLEVKDEETGEKVTVTKQVNVVRFKDSSEIDGTLISEVKQGKDGASIKLPSREKALDWLAKHMDMATAEQRAKLELLKAQTAKISGDEQEEVQDDGFLEALNGSAAGDWDDED